MVFRAGANVCSLVSYLIGPWEHEQDKGSGMWVFEERIQPCTVFFFSLGILVFCFTFSAGTAANKSEEADSQPERLVRSRF